MQAEPKLEMDNAEGQGLTRKGELNLACSGIIGAEQGKSLRCLN